MRKLDVQKTNNCFADAQTFEYHLPCQNEALLDIFATWGELSCRQNLRRPVLMLTTRDGIRAKGILKGSVLRASFPSGSWREAKAVFEERLLDALEKEERDKP